MKLRLKLLKKSTDKFQSAARCKYSLTSFGGNTRYFCLNLRLQFSKSKHFLGQQTAVNADNDLQLWKMKSSKSPIQKPRFISSHKEM